MIDRRSMTCAGATHHHRSGIVASRAGITACMLKVSPSSSQVLERDPTNKHSTVLGGIGFGCFDQLVRVRQDALNQPAPVRCGGLQQPRHGDRKENQLASSATSFGRMKERRTIDICAEIKFAVAGGSASRA